MIATSLFAGILTTVGFLFLALKFGPEFVRTLLGYHWATDIVMSVVCLWLFALSGTISGMMTGVMTALFISVLLSVARNVFGYRTWTRKTGWTEHSGKWASKARTWFGGQML